VARVHGEWSLAQRRECFWQSLVHLVGSTDRPASGARGSSLLGWRRLRIHHPTHASWGLSFERDGDTERFTVDTTAGKGATLNLHVDHFLRLADVIDLRRTGHDVVTLMLKPTAARLRWLPSLCKDAVRLLLVLGTMGVFHLRKLVAGRS
jgi:hypothetical protein